MKAISLWQPWASAIAVGAKRIETRSWPTKHRGPILIHAAKHRDADTLFGLDSSWTWCGVFRDVIVKKMGDDKTISELLPFGAVIAKAFLIDCRPTESFTIGEIEYPRFPTGETHDLYSWTEKMMGDYTIGRFGWMLENIEVFKTPIPFKGKQQLFDVPDALLTGAEFTR